MVSLPGAPRALPCALALRLLYRAFAPAAQPPIAARREFWNSNATLVADVCHSRGASIGRDDATLAALDAAAHEGNQLAPELDRVLERVESADQHGVCPGVVVVEQGFGDLLGGPDQRRGAAGGSRGGGDRGPEALVVHLAPAGKIEQPLRADALRPCRRCRAAPQLHDALENAARAGPGFLLGRAEDRTHRHAEPRRAAWRRGGAYLVDRLSDGRDRLTPERVDVAVAGADCECCAGGAAEVDRNRRLL